MQTLKQIKVLGPGCNSCRSTAALINEVAEARGIAIRLEEIYEDERIAELGVKRAPAVMVDGKIMLEGNVPDWPQIEFWLTSAGL